MSAAGDRALGLEARIAKLEIGIAALSGRLRRDATAPKFRVPETNPLGRMRWWR